jgi:erythromycin esterase
MMKRLSLLVVFATACNGHNENEMLPDAALDAPPPDAGLPVGVTQFGGTDPTLAPDDLAPLLSLVGDARYIGIGESVHTSGGFYAMKRRLIEDLIANQGLRVLAMETPRTSALKLDSYIQSGTGDVKTALSGIFPVFADDNTEMLFEWIAAFNQQHPTDHVHFFGFDEQQPDDDAAQLQSFFTTAAATDEATLYGALSTCRLSDASSFDPNGNPLPYSQSDYAQCTAGLDALDAYVAAHKPALAAATTARDEELAEVASISLRAWQGELVYYVSNVPKSYEARDVAMHQIFARLRDLDYPGQRIMIWMHNYHLQADHPDVTGDDLGGVQTFGTELRAEVGAAYVPIALIGYDVEINWPSVGYGPLPLPTQGSVEANLHGLGAPYLIVDPKAPFVGTTTTTLSETQMIVSQQFGALVYLEHSPPMNALFWSH